MICVRNDVGALAICYRALLANDQCSYVASRLPRYGASPAGIQEQFPTCGPRWKDAATSTGLVMLVHLGNLVVTYFIKINNCIQNEIIYLNPIYYFASVIILFVTQVMHELNKMSPGSMIHANARDEHRILMYPSLGSIF